MNVSRKSIALYVALVFVSGAVLGVFGDRLYTVTTVASKNTKAKLSPEEFRRGYLGFMQKRLTLSETQVTQLKRFWMKPIQTVRRLYRNSRKFEVTIRQDHAHCLHLPSSRNTTSWSKSAESE